MPGSTTADRRGANLPGTDGRFTALDEALASSSPRVVSVDVFDTLLVRRVPKATDAHLLLGRKLLDDGLLRPHVSPRIFARLRIMAEEEARARMAAWRGSTEVTLADIYAVLAPAVTDRLGVPEMASLEIGNEQSLTFPDLSVVSYLRRRLGDDVRLVAVSDTYLSAFELRSLLGHHGLDVLELFKVYSSSDCGVGKGSGLWNHVVRDLGTEPDEILHTGDNYDADVVAPRAGVRAVHLPVSTERFAAITVREGIAGDTGEPSHWCDDGWGDGGLTAARRRASLVRSSAGALTADEQVAWETGTSVLGPVLACFAQWVHDQAASLGAERALCVMREGRFLKRLLDGAEPDTGRRLATRTVWASREGCARASVYEGTETELRTFLSRLHPPTPSQLVGSLGIDPGEHPEVASLLDHLAARGDDPRAGESVVELVLARKDLVEAVVARSRVRRRRLVQHLRAAARPDTSSVVLVDVGWGGTILDALRRMLTEEGEDLALHGLYLLAHIGSAGPLLRGSALQGYLGDAGSIPFDIAGITGNPELVELASMCDSGTFLEIGESGEPVLAPTSTSPEQSRHRALLQDGVMAFQAEWLRQRDPEGRYESSDAARAALRRILERFLSQPDEQEASAFAWWEHEENFGSGDIEQLVPSRLLPTLHHRTTESLHGTPANELYWVGGAAALVGRESADSILLLRRGAVGPGRFSSASDAGPARIALGLPDGSEATVTEANVEMNRCGLTLVEWTGDARSATSVRIHPARRPSVLRIDRLTVVATDSTGTVLDECTWTAPDKPAGVELHDTATLADRTYAVDERSTLEIAVPGGGAAARTLSVALAGAYLPVPGIPALRDALSYPGVAGELAAVQRELTALRQTKLFRTAALPRRIYGQVLRHLRRVAP